MGLIDLDSESAARPPQSLVRTRARQPRIAPEFEADLRQLYARMMDEPVPARLLGVLRAALSAPRF